MLYSGKLNKDFGVDNLDSYMPCNESDFCYDFTFIIRSPKDFDVS